MIIAVLKNISTSGWYQKNIPALWYDLFLKKIVK
jgi:hypothetical protein